MNKDFEEELRKRSEAAKASAVADAENAVQKFRARSSRPTVSGESTDAFEEIRYRNSAWKAFPRSIGMIAAAIALIATLSPFTAIQVYLVVWLVIFVIKSILPSNIGELNLWYFVSVPVQIVGMHGIRELAYVIAVAVALVMGAPLTATLLIMGGVLIFDLLF